MAKQLPRTDRRNSLRLEGGSLVLAIEADAVGDLGLEAGDTPDVSWTSDGQVTLDFGD